MKHARLLTSHRGMEGGYVLSRPPAEISLAEIMRVIDGPLVNLRDSRIGQLSYADPSEALEEVWMAVRASVRALAETYRGSGAQILNSVPHPRLPPPRGPAADGGGSGRTG